MTISGPSLEILKRDESVKQRKELVEAIRRAAKLSEEIQLSDERIFAAVVGFADQFDYWFTRVIREAVKQYRNLIISRINPFVRRIEYDGLRTHDVACKLVSDYTNRNFVTAGGWAIEKMAISLGAKNSKAAARGIDLHKIDSDSGNQHLYVIKSGKVTRNSDILKALKQHARDAEKLLRQGGAKVGVFANYAVATGATTSTFHDGIYRPSSGTFWSEMTGLEAQEALDLASEITLAAGRLIKRDSTPHIEAMTVLVEAYIASNPNFESVDWEFVFSRTMREKSNWAKEDKARHAQALSTLAATGYVFEKTTPKSAKKRLSAKSP